MRSLLFLILFGTSIHGLAQKSGYGKYLDVNYGCGFFLPHKSDVAHLQGGLAMKGELSLTFRTNGSKFHHNAYKLPYFGWAAGFSDSGNPKLIGYQGYVMTFGGLPVYFSKKNPLIFKVGIGLGYVQHIYNKYSNPIQNAIGSHVNVNLAIRLEKTLMLPGIKFINLGAGITHYSNASFQTPNLGLNYFHVYIGKRFQFREPDYISDTATVIAILPYRPKRIDFMLNFGLKENFAALGKKYPIINSSIHYIKQFNVKRSWSNGLDVYWNQALAVAEGKTWQIGISTMYQANFNHLKIGLGLGYYLLNKPRVSGASGLYHKVMVQYFLNSKYSLLVNLRTHWAVADFFTLGFGYTL